MKKRKIISIILVTLWMGFIFIMSSFDSVESSSQSNAIVNFVVGILNISNSDVISLIVRKLAHFTEYFILGILVQKMLRYFDRKYYIAIIICVLYAISDEVHQLFVPGRSFQIYDMLIDSFGSLVGILFVNIFIKKKNEVDIYKGVTIHS